MSSMLPLPCICLSHRAMRTAGLLATKPTLESAFANESKRRARRQRRSQLGYSALETGSARSRGGFFPVTEFPTPRKPGDRVAVVVIAIAGHALIREQPVSGACRLDEARAG
jgi:hypothetical protein